MYTAAILFGQALLIPAMAYALSRFKFRGRDALFFVVIMLMLLPFQVTMVPNVITLRAMGLLDTIWGDHSADDGRAVLHLSAAAVHGWPAG